MNIIGIGTDLTDIRRIEKTYNQFKERFINKLLTKNEQKHLPEKLICNFLAKRWAGKEAVLKAMGGSINFQDIEIYSLPTGQPQVKIISKPNLNCFISITDEYPYAQAMVLISN